MTSHTELEKATTEIAAGMIRCTTCPCCGGRELHATPSQNDLHSIAGVNGGMKDSEYHACGECGLIFARRRQTPDQAALYYQYFAHLEHRDYAIYPPPNSYVTAKELAASKHLSFLEDHCALSNNINVAHVRCDFGSLLEKIVARYPGSSIYGFDYFESNIRFARERGLKLVESLNPAGIGFPKEVKFDLIICNHLLPHSLNPSNDLQKLRRSLKPNGLIYFYNEADHLIRFDPAKKGYQWVMLNNFHKQLFSMPSLLRFLEKEELMVKVSRHNVIYIEVLAGLGAIDRNSKNLQQAIEAAPIVIRNFQLWAKRRKNPFLIIFKLLSKLKWAMHP